MIIDIIDRIPHIYHDTIYARKLFELVHTYHLKIIEVWKQIGSFNDLDNLKGPMLDMYGGNFNVDREGRNDDEYRKSIEFEIGRTKLIGSVENIIELLRRYFNLDTSDFRIVEGAGKIMLYIPETLDSTKVLAKLNQLRSAGIGMEFGYIIEILSDIKFFSAINMVKKITIDSNILIDQIQKFKIVENLFTGINVVKTIEIKIGG